MTGQRHRYLPRYDETGMSMVEVMIVTMVMTTLIAISVPAGRSALDSLELSTAREEVGFALRTARLRAVSANRSMRLRLNCQATGQYRVVEVTGLASTLFI